MLIVSCGYFGAARSVKVPQSPAGNDHFRLRAAPKIKNGGWNHLLHFSSHSYPKPLPERLATCESQSYRWPNYCISARRIASRQQIFINSPATWLRRGGVSPLRVFPRVTGILLAVPGSTNAASCIGFPHHPPGSHVLRSSPDPARAHLTPDAGKGVPRCRLRSSGETNTSSILTSPDFTFDAYMGSLSTTFLVPT